MLYQFQVYFTKLYLARQDAQTSSISTGLLATQNYISHHYLYAVQFHIISNHVQKNSTNDKGK